MSNVVNGARPPAGVVRDRPCVLLIQASDRASDVLRENLAADRMHVVRGTGVGDARGALVEERPDVVMIDIAVRGSAGLELISSIRDGDADRNWDPTVPILAACPADDPYAAARALERGADDAVSAPYHYAEVLARLLALVRRSSGVNGAETLCVGALVVDRQARRATFDGRRVALSAKEFLLLAHLAKSPQRVFTKEELLRDVWGYSTRVQTRTIDTHACRLRRKLAEAHASDGFVANVWGIGYRLLPLDV